MASVSDALLKVGVDFVQTFYTAAALDGHTRQELERAIEGLEHSEQLSTVMCMGHNKGWQEAATSFAGAPVSLKTATAALLEGSGATWEEAFQQGFCLQGILTPQGLTGRAQEDEAAKR
uniref:Phosphoglycerate mutase family protein n=1 Tax=Tetraselmis sp. GSL018 TaxID=582737 RepID=A0A061R5Z5_9CHLO|mmetsp:Transcript_16870/g.40207  ORF Transcript_16870/g.40207 Transcript_16870/m.40207 type:complete len:119 (+) Transcript_16870:519-875(+)